MDALMFRSYLRKFEHDVIAAGVEKGLLGKDKLVPLRNGKLARSKFGKLIGVRIDSEIVFAVDYYGHMKKSRGLVNTANDTSAEKEGQVRLLEAPVVHFASIKIEDIASLDVNMIALFPTFKQKMLIERGFKK